MNPRIGSAFRNPHGLRRLDVEVIAFLRRHRARVVAMTFALCSVLPSIQSANAGGHDRPMGGSCATAFEFTGVGAVQLEGTCQLLHLGLTSTVATQIVIPLPDGTLHITNAIVYTAANGDELYANFLGVGEFTSPSSVSFSGTETYDGGTGRFANASGSAAIVGTAQFTSATGGVGEFTGNGTISY